MTLAGTMIAGHLDTVDHFAAVSLGGALLNLTYWTFLFLRFSTTGLTSQATGAGDSVAAANALLRSLIIALACGLVLFLTRTGFAGKLLPLLGGTGHVRDLAAEYAAIRLWSAPAALANFVLVGFLIGKRRAASALMLQVVVNILNVAVGYLLVFQFKIGVAGIALGSVVADWVGVAGGMMLVLRIVRFESLSLSFRELADRREVLLLFGLNRDFMIRSFALMTAQFLVVRASAGQGTAVLAANTILLNLNTFFAHAIDGFSYAAQTLVGVSIGSRNIRMLEGVIRAAFILGGAVSIVLAVTTWIFAQDILSAVTTHGEVRLETFRYLPWLLLLPPSSFWCFVLDGIFIGAVRAREARNSVVLSVAIFVPVHFALLTVWANDGLWAAFLLLMALRGIMACCRFRGHRDKVFNGTGELECREGSSAASSSLRR